LGLVRKRDGNNEIKRTIRRSERKKAKGRKEKG
jgi:hypothetical protein